VELGGAFRLRETVREVHPTPAGTRQEFWYCRFTLEWWRRQSRDRATRVREFRKRIMKPFEPQPREPRTAIGIS
jgi:hypothetical protein